MSIDNTPGALRVGFGIENKIVPALTGGRPRRRIQATALLFSALLSGCAEMPAAPQANDRAFNFDRDTFAYANELDWEYRIDPVSGKTTIQLNEPAPQFIHRCFAVSHMARQFFRYASFDPSLPKIDDAGYRNLISEVTSRSSGPAEQNGRIVIPGYADLRSLSQANVAMLKEASGSSLRSYFQLSNWRMIFPFGRDRQEAEARRVLEEEKANRLPIMHLIRFSPFPIADINHVIVVTSASETPTEIRFSVYDPNNAQTPGVLSFDFTSRSFIFPTTNYFADGPVNAYEIFRDDAD
jgi:hypothetical protein